MFKVISRTAGRGSPPHNLHFLLFQIHPFSSSSLKSIQNSPNQESFTVNYLINSCGFSPEKAISASKYVKFETPDKPDSVLAFFKNHEFTQTQISSIVTKYPRLLICDTEKTLLPKLEFFKSKGLSSTDVATMVNTYPHFLKRSLEKLLIPAFNFFSNLLRSEEKAITAIRRCPRLLWFDKQNNVAPNMEILRKAGVPNANIMHLLAKQPRAFMLGSDRFRQLVEKVGQMGINPLRMKFLVAVRALRAMSKSTWEKKVDVYKKWGCTEDEILVAFKKHPACIMASEDKINRVMDFFVNEMGWESSFVAKWPGFICISLEKKTVPRSAVYQALLSKGIIGTNDITLTTFLRYTETQFLQKVLSYKKEEGPELLKLYKEKLDLAK